MTRTTASLAYILAGWNTSTNGFSPVSRAPQPNGTVSPNCRQATLSMSMRWFFEAQNPDLYFALTGGGNNFGIVTAFIVRAFSQGPVSTTSTTYSSIQIEQVLDRICELFTIEALTSTLDLGYDMYYTYMSENDTFGLSSTQRHAKPIPNPPVFNAIDQIPTGEKEFSYSQNAQSDPRIGTVG